MKKTLLLLLFFSLQASSQFPLYTLLPLGINGVVFSDTLLNTSAILQRQGIKKITAAETSSDRSDGASFTTIYHVNNGKIEARYWCYRPSPDTAFRFCTRDTLLYDNNGNLQFYLAGGNETTAYLKLEIKRQSNENILHSWITKDPQTSVYDTSVSYRVYNEKGQLVSQRYPPGARYIVNASLYYNEDGFPDSIRHENPAWKTYLFKRKKKGKNRELAVETQNGTYRWVYNKTGQCIAYHWSSKKPEHMRAQSYQPSYVNITYAYNADGTLSKVEAKRRNNKTTTVYSYLK